ncbi:hypothetical protein NH8B_0955 [Pseudogulbenkiania sp. NH8B]|uniref:hypothetical protein n=1 Tax=Pseudogulbenkiania sp. (strain NH8B) TaxID=748280 RepID=UPI0002279A79|nr:hypothetical protein [Pseudogulbenkiania sp. NH8B]BAK75787.1 hypothetical protein NH8B_0955 [Pseudogulbenkiania sp. NH8B]
MNQEQLQRFCAPAGDYRGIDKPIRRGGFIYATNGHVLVRVADSPDIECSSEHAPLPTLDSLAEEAAALPDYKPLHIHLPPPTTCGACDGHGKVSACNVCNGEGEFRHGRHSYECRECDGHGFFGSTAGTIACTHCDGTGHGPYQRVVVEREAGFARHYLALIQTLPNVKFAANAKDPIHGIAGFLFDGGVGALMPLWD